MKEVIGNEWDGFDGQATIYNEKKEKRWQSSVWKVIACLSAAVLMYIFANHMQELYIIRNGSSIEAVYDENTMMAKCFDENGKWHSYDLSGYYPITQNGHVTLYYMENVLKSQPKNSTVSRVGFYMLFISIFALSVWRIVKIYNFDKNSIQGAVRKIVSVKI